jgi:hypothetical protein
MTRKSWSRLTTFLEAEAKLSTVLSFQQIERIIEHALPASAYNHPAFWSNTSSYSRAWRDAGREVSRRGLLPENIRFTQIQPRRRATDLRPGSLAAAMRSPALRIVPETSERRHTVPEQAPEDTAVQPATAGAEGDALASGIDVLLLGCVKNKASAPQRAKDLDVSDLFSKRRRYANRRGVPWFVLSAEHGLLLQNDLVAPYDVLMRAQPASYRSAWGAWVIERLRRELGGELTGVRLEVHAADAYAEALIKPGHAAGAAVIRPLLGLRHGEQLAWYLSHPASPDTSA